MRKSATAFAPATIANVGVGFDILGFPVNAVGDEVTVVRTERPGEVEIETITGGRDIPLDAAKNTATVGLLKLCQDRALKFGFRLSIRKGIPIGSGMGGSAASAVGAIVAANALLEDPLSESELLSYALEGESVASGSKHADNIAPCLLGGLILSRSVNPPTFVRIPVPSELRCVLVHPELRVNTREARGILKNEILLKDHIQQSANLAGFLAGCFTSDFDLIRDALSDVVIEPQRAHLIQGFYEVKAAALQHGALGFSISGSGPSVFAFAPNDSAAHVIQSAILKMFLDFKVEAQGWISSVRLEGAKLL